MIIFYQKKTGMRNLQETINYMNNKNLDVISDYCFVNEIYISNKGSEFHFDLENFLFIKPFNNNFIVEKVDNEELIEEISSYKNIKSVCALCITTHTSTYGFIKLYLYKYNNPQIRNSFKLIAQKEINDKNARGCILYKQSHNNITINSIKSNEIISKAI